MIEKNDQEDSKIDFKLLNSLSLSALIKLLVEKGVVQWDDLIQSENEYQKARREERNNAANGQRQPGLSHWLKNQASKYRWSRLLTGRLFGWEWKRIKIRTTDNNEHIT